VSRHRSSYRSLYPRGEDKTFDCEEDRTLLVVLVGILRETEGRGDGDVV
jgi:hypothetical protein